MANAMGMHKGDVVELSKGAHKAAQVDFADLLNVEPRAHQNHFIRYQSNGQLPALEPVRKEPEITQEELERRRLEQLERETYQRAFAAGERAGLEMGGQRINLVLRQLDATLRALDALPQRIMAASEQFLVEVVVVVLRQLLKHELSMQPEGIAARVSAVLAEAVGRERLVIHLHPDDARLAARLPGFEQLDVRADPGVKAGSVRLESAFGGLEDDLDKQLELVEQGLRRRLHGRLEEIASQIPPERPPVELLPEPPAGRGAPARVNKLTPAELQGILDPQSEQEDPGVAAWEAPLEPPPPRVHATTPHLDELPEEEDWPPQSLSAMAAPPQELPSNRLVVKAEELDGLPPVTGGQGRSLKDGVLIARQPEQEEVVKINPFQRDFSDLAPPPKPKKK